MANAGLRAAATALIVTGLVFGLSACGGGGGGGGSDSPTVGSPPPPPSTTTPPPSQGGSSEELVDNDLSGSVGDGPIVGAHISIFNKPGTLVATYESDETASYTVTVREKGKNYPLTLHAARGTDLVTGMLPDFALRSAVAKSAKNSRSNLNPHSTLMVDIAGQMSGGLSDNSLASARTTVLTELNFGMDPNLVYDPITTEITLDNVAVVVKASETMGEMVRRTRDALLGAGVADGDAVMAALAADLLDGTLDGKGSTGTDPRVSAVATVVSGAVLLEAMENRLRVYDVDATSAMDAAIRVVRPDATSAHSVGGVTIPYAMIEQARIAVDAAWALTGDPVLDQLRARIRELTGGASPGTLKGSFPTGSDQSLADAAMAAAYASDADLEIVNATVRSNGAPDPEPPPPEEPPPGGTTGYATLSWVPPTQREDGTALTDLTGYHVHYGQTSGNLTEVLRLDDPSLTSYTLQGLGTGTWYFAITAIDSEGRESQRSNEASKTIS